MKAKYLLAAMLVGGCAAASQGQQAVAPPPKPADSGPSLAVTLQFIQDKVAAQGKQNYALYVHDNAAGNDWILQKSYEFSNFTANPAGCLLSFHYKWTASFQAAAEEGDGGIPFRLVEDAIVLPVEREVKEADDKNGNTTRTYRSDPPIFVLRVRRRAGGGANEFNFTDEDLANRVAKAIVHAVELCGGGSKDPF